MDFRPRQFQASQLVLLAHFAELTVREMEQELVGACAMLFILGYPVVLWAGQLCCAELTVQGSCAVQRRSTSL